MLHPELQELTDVIGDINSTYRERESFSRRPVTTADHHRAEASAPSTPRYDSGDKHSDIRINITGSRSPPLDSPSGPSGVSALRSLLQRIQSLSEENRGMERHFQKMLRHQEHQMEAARVRHVEELGALRSQLETTRKENDEGRHREAGLHNELKHTQQVAKQAETARCSLDARLSELHQTMSAELERAAAKTNELETKYTKLESASQASTRDLEHTIVQLKEQLVHEQNGVKSLTDENKDMERHFQKLLKHHEQTFAAARTRHEEELEAVRSRLETAQRERDEVERREAGLHSELKHTQQVAKQAEAARCSLETRLSELHQTMSAELMNAASKTNELEAKYAKLENASQATTRELEQSVAHLKAQLCREQEGNKEVRRANAVLEERVEKYRLAALDMHKTIRTLANENEQFRTHITAEMTIQRPEKKRVVRKVAGKKKKKKKKKLHSHMGYTLPFTVGRGKANNKSFSVPAVIQEILAKEPQFLTPSGSTLADRVLQPSHEEHRLRVTPSLLDMAYPAAGTRRTHDVPTLDGAESKEAPPPPKPQLEWKHLQKLLERGELTEATLLPVVESLEKEVTMLNSQYAEQLKKSRQLHSFESGVSLDKELRSLMAELELKSQQLYLLKKHQRAVRRSTAPKRRPRRKSSDRGEGLQASYYSPQAKHTYDKKVKSLRLLSEFQKLFHEDKNQKGA